MTVRLEMVGSEIALVVIDNQAKRNALGVDEFHELAELWQRLRANDALRCAVITGDGTDAFCSGADLGADFSSVPDVDALVDAALLKTAPLPVPLIAAVNGHCVAGGFELMLASDIRVANEKAKLGLPEVRWGIVPSGGGTMKLIEQIGYARAMHLLLSGEMISAEGALTCGLVNEVVESRTVLSRALTLAEGIAKCSPAAVRATKAAALQELVPQWRARESCERQLAKGLRASPDQAEGKRAFLAKREPHY